MLSADANGMIYAEHNFSKNYFNAVGHNDKFSIKHQLIDELGKLIITNRKDIVDLLRNSGINISIKDNELKVGEYLSNELSKGNKSITEGIVNLITDKYDINEKSIKGTSYEKFFKADRSNNKAKGLDYKSSLSNNLSEIFGRKKNSSNVDKATARDTANLLSERIKLNQMVRNADGTSNGMAKWLKITLYSAAGIVLIIGIVFIIRHSLKAKTSFSGSSPINTPTSTPTTTPTV